MAQRISLAKQSIKASGVPFEPPAAEERAARLGAVMPVLYLIFSEGCTASSGPGELVPLDEQDRTLWDRDAIAEGVALVTATLPKGAVGPHQLQAAIAAVHDEAKSADATDWAEILGLYGILLRMSDNPMIALNHAIATTMVHGPAAGLELIDALAADTRLEDHHRLYAVRAHLLERAGNRDGAIAHYERAAQRTASLPEGNYLLMHAARLSDRNKGCRPCGVESSRSACARTAAAD